MTFENGNRSVVTVVPIPLTQNWLVQCSVCPRCGRQPMAPENSTVIVKDETTIPPPKISLPPSWVGGGVEHRRINPWKARFRNKKTYVTSGGILRVSSGVGQIVVPQFVKFFLPINVPVLTRACQFSTGSSSCWWRVKNVGQTLHHKNVILLMIFFWKRRYPAGDDHYKNWSWKSRHRGNTDFPS